MKIELMGLPGCGKTTFVKEFLETNNNVVNPLNLYLYNDSRIKQNQNKLKLCFTFFFLKPGVSIRILRLFKNIKFSSFQVRLKMFLYLFSTVSVIENSQLH